MLAASLSGLHLDFVPGVRTEDMSKKAFPLVSDPMALELGLLT